MPRLTFSRYLPLPLELLPAVRLGDLSLIEFAIIAVLSLESMSAGTPGMVYSSIPAIVAQYQGFRVTATRAAFQRLAKGLRLKPFRALNPCGKYWIAIDGFVVNRDGTQWRLDAAATTDPKQPVWVPCPPGAIRNEFEEGSGAPFEQASLPETPPPPPPQPPPPGGGPHILDSRIQNSPLTPDDVPTADAAPDAVAMGGTSSKVPAGPGTGRASSEHLSRLVHLWQELAAAKDQARERSYQKHARVFADLDVLAGNDAAKCEAVVREYFADNDLFIAKSGWSIAVFAGRMRGYLPSVAPSKAAPLTHPIPPDQARPAPASKTEAAAAVAAIRARLPRKDPLP